MDVHPTKNGINMYYIIGIDPYPYSGTGGNGLSFCLMNNQAIEVWIETIETLGRHWGKW
jgi:hypothetical protein